VHFQIFAISLEKSLILFAKEAEKMYNLCSEISTHYIGGYYGTK